MQKHWDVYFGVGGTVGSITLGQVNAVLGTVTMILTLGVMALRLRREWKSRNKDPNE